MNDDTMRINETPPASRVIMIMLVGVIIYMAAFSLLNPVVPSETGPMRGRFPGNFSTTGSFILNTSSIALGLAGMLVSSFVLFRRSRKGYDEAGPNQQNHADDFSIMKRALNDDETALLERVREVPGGITQDSLRFRLGWSKAKVSTMLTNLDRMGLVQRERFGKTYKVYYQGSSPDDSLPGSSGTGS
ncbi:MAG: hypothetical protein KAT35_02030 [Candidatus Aenigmarchaeota archaeon]|nr:hypothetical protein [Candidatus Aenigmarchaeota archaeon]